MERITREAVALTSSDALAPYQAMGALFSDTQHPYGVDKKRIASPKKCRKEHRQQFKSEANAQQMLQDLIGLEQWAVYRKTNRVLVEGKHFWMIGNVFGKYDKFRPFSGKPDAVRIDAKGKRTQATSFCVMTSSGEVPYTDKVISFAIHCSDDEKGFYKTGNRIDEHVFNKLPQCALFSLG